MSWSEIGAVETKGTGSGFLDAVKIWCGKPHVVNRRLCGARMLWSETVVPSADLSFDVAVSLWQKVCRLLKSDLMKNDFEGCLTLIRETFGSISSQYGKNSTGSSQWTVTVRCLIPKQEKKMQKTLEIVIIDSIKFEGIFLPICEVNAESDLLSKSSDFPYKILFCQNIIKLYMYTYSEQDAALKSSCGSYSQSWLVDVLLIKLARWCEEAKLNTEITSLRLICIQRYNQVYNELKMKYGQYFVKIWPEQTDPSKFVYEDIGIAAYLLVLWEAERSAKGLKSRQSFVDIGCGNGLLVYLLTAEGHPGCGIDIRRRKIWDLLSDVAELKECTVTPSDESLFPSHDWLIGNHSDELTPWIPVIAARSHYNCRYFVLPCCAWDFADKFNCNNKGQQTSQYHSYLEFVKEVGQVCGFDVEHDILRIPSTKRACFVGMRRSYSFEDEPSVDCLRQNYIKSRCQDRNAKKARISQPSDTSECSNCNVNDTNCSHYASSEIHTLKQSSLQNLHHESCPESKDGCPSAEICNSNSAVADDCSDLGISNEKSPWLATFQPRPSTEKPRNAISIEQSVKDHISTTVLMRILQTTNTVNLSDGRPWNKGEMVALHELSQLFNRDILLQLKNECGGLQTLLKNCPDVFVVRDGSVGIRDWTSKDYADYRTSRNKKRPNSVGKAKQLMKTKLCFFFKHHPDGCPLDCDGCRFAHGAEDLTNHNH